MLRTSPDTTTRGTCCIPIYTQDRNRDSECGPMPQQESRRQKAVSHCTQVGHRSWGERAEPAFDPLAHRSARTGSQHEAREKTARARTMTRAPKSTPTRLFCFARKKLINRKPMLFNHHRCRPRRRYRYRRGERKHTHRLIQRGISLNKPQPRVQGEANGDEGRAVDWEPVKLPVEGLGSTFVAGLRELGTG